MADLGEGAGFGDHQLGDRGCGRVLDASGHELQDAGQQAGHGAAMGGQHRFHRHEVGRDGLPDHALEEGELVVEVEIDRRLAETRPPGDVVQARAGKARLDELGEGGIQYFLRPFGRGATLLDRLHTTNLLVS